MEEYGKKFFLILQLWLHYNIIHTYDPPCLYYSVGNAINKIDLSTEKPYPTVVVQNIGRAIAVAVDVKDKFIYWSDIASSSIKRMNLQTNTTENVANVVGKVEGIAIDWEKKYIYWTDTANNRIEMSRVNGTDRKVLFDKDIEEPRGIAVDPVHGYIFWTDWGSNPKIERATLEGHGRITIVEASSSFQLKFVNDVIVDYTDSTIYWVDAALGKVGKADLDGRNRNQSEAMTNSNLFGIALQNDTIYLSDLKAKTIKLVNKKSLKYLGKLDLSLLEILGITMFDGSRQPRILTEATLADPGSIRVTVEMKIEEWKEEKFKQAIVNGLRDYCLVDNCTYNTRNETIVKQFCSSFLNGSTNSTSRVRVIKGPRESSAPKQTEVVFAVVLPAESSSGVMVVNNSTLEYIVQKSANFISKHLGGNKIVYVNNFPPSSRRRCDKETEDDAVITAIIVGVGIIVVLAMIIAIVAIWYFRRRRKQDIQEGPNGELRLEVHVNQGVDQARERGQQPGGENEEVDDPQLEAGGYEEVDPLNIHNPQPAAGGYEEVDPLNIHNPQPAAGGYGEVAPLNIQNPQPAAGGYEVVPAASLQPQATNDNTQSGIQQTGNQNDVQNLTYSNNFIDQREENGEQLAGGTEKINAPGRLIPKNLINKTFQNQNRLNQQLPNSVEETCETYENRFTEDTGSQHLEGVDNINQGRRDPEENDDAKTGIQCTEDSEKNAR